MKTIDQHNAEIAAAHPKERSDKVKIDSGEDKELSSQELFDGMRIKDIRRVNGVYVVRGLGWFKPTDDD